MARKAKDPQRWAVLVGINGYHESLSELRFCVNDAKLMRDTLVSEACGFAPENVILLADDQPKDNQPTYGSIHSWLGTWLSRPGADDLVLVYFAGHGRQLGDRALLAPSDATLDSLSVTGIPIQYVTDLLERCKAERKVLILDACHSGSGRDVAAMTCTFRNAIDVGKGLYTIASCDADQISYEWPEKKHGVFTHYLAEAIREGAPSDAQGNVTLDAVYSWARENVLDWAGGKRIKQEPVRICRLKGSIHIARRGRGSEQRLGQATMPHQEPGDRTRQERRKLRPRAEGALAGLVLGIILGAVIGAVVAYGSFPLGDASDAELRQGVVPRMLVGCLAGMLGGLVLGIPLSVLGAVWPSRLWCFTYIVLTVLAACGVLGAVVGFTIWAKSDTRFMLANLMSLCALAGVLVGALLGLAAGWWACLKPGNPFGHRMDGCFYAKRGDDERAIAHLSKAIKLKPDYETAYYDRGIVHAGRGDYERAIVDLGKAIELGPNHAWAYLCRGRAYSCMGEYDLARCDYEKAVALDSRGWAGKCSKRDLEELHNR